MQIALIPHVVWEGNDDRKPIQELYNIFKNTGRVIMIKDHNCMELKGYIARCRMFIGARTHSTIAAYSSCVPTLVVGYSVKAKGIAKDIFGTYENYVVPVQTLENQDDLIRAFKWMKANENDIRNHLRGFMPEYCARAWLAGDEVEKLI
jgi:polysaccharide pyruvyl transferase WcaK-like protein